MNSRAWPAGCVISDPMCPPPIAEEIDLHVIDLKNLREEKMILRSHKAYTPNDECFFIFLDVSRDFVARSARPPLRFYGIQRATGNDMLAYFLLVTSSFISNKHSTWGSHYSQCWPCQLPNGTVNKQVAEVLRCS